LPHINNYALKKSFEHYHFDIFGETNDKSAILAIDNNVKSVFSIILANINKQTFIPMAIQAI